MALNGEDRRRNNEETLDKDYEKIYQEASVIPQQVDTKEVSFFASLVQSTEKLQILDIGCAEGRLAVSLALKGHLVTAIDISERFLNTAKRLSIRNKVNIETAKCDIENDVSNLRGKAFDVIFFMDVIEHLKNPVKALGNIRTLLSDNGTLFIHTPNVLTPARFMRYLVKRKELMNYYVPKNLSDLHFQTYDYLSLEKTLNFIGFRIYEVVPTRLTLPKFHHFAKFLAKQFPFLSDTLLLVCMKASPINVKSQIQFWAHSLK